MSYDFAIKVGKFGVFPICLVTLTQTASVSVELASVPADTEELPRAE